jgi:uncharacterized protein YlxW (UPF0749 family)
MKKNKRIILGSAIGFIVLICFQVFSTGHGHVVVVKENIALTDKVNGLTKENTGLKKQVSTLKTKVSDLTSLNESLSTEQEEVSKNESIVENIKPKAKDKKNEKASTSDNNDATSGFSINAISDPEGD